MTDAAHILVVDDDREIRGRDFDPFDRSIDVRVSRLRQTLGEDARAPCIVKTVYGEVTSSA